MKKIITIAAMASAMCLTACYHEAQVEEESEIIEQQQGKEVQFVVKGIEVDYSSRATIASEGMTDLWVWEGQTLLDHQISTDEDFGTPTIALKYGSHDMTFVASKAQGQTWGSGEWQCTKVADTYATTMNVTVSKGSANSRQVQLGRANSKVQWTIEDALPTEVKSIVTEVQTHYALTAALAGASATTYTRTLDVSGHAGETGIVISSAILTATYGAECNIDATITFKDSAGATLYTYTNTVAVKSNRVTNIHGSFFGGGSANEVSLITAWDTTNDVDL